MACRAAGVRSAQHCLHGGGQHRFFGWQASLQPHSTSGLAEISRCLQQMVRVAATRGSMQQWQLSSLQRQVLLTGPGCVVDPHRTARYGLT